MLAGGGHNPSMLPNNMCCPFLETTGIAGTPYHSAIHGCCDTKLYDLYTQECCADQGVILEKVILPFKFKKIISHPFLIFELNFFVKVLLAPT